MKTPMKKYNRKSLIEACYQEIIRPETTIKLVNITDHAEADSTFPVDGRHELKVRVDPDKSGIIRATLHEALHAVLSPQMEPFNWRLEEDIIRKLEDVLWERTFEKSDVTKWRRAINKKLGVNDDS